MIRNKVKEVIAVCLLLVALPAGAQVGGEFRFERLGDDRWLAGWCFDQPVEAIRFERPFEGLREKAWRAGDQAFELRYADGAAELLRRDGRSFECATVTVSPWYELPEKNYYAFSAFSNGGMSVYTGYFTGPVKIDGEWLETSLDAVYSGRQGEAVITRVPDRLVHQFVYFGNQAVLETGGVVAVIDPAMPSVARRKILETIPAVNALLAETFGFRPDAPYLVFMATDMDAFDGHSIKGGTQPGQILFTLKGRGIEDLLDREPAYLARIAAHEVLHLWQSERWFESLGNDAPWMHEGSADALSLEVMRRTGIHDARRYAEAWLEWEESCLDNLAATTVHDAPEQGRFDVVYSCGALVNRLAAEALAPEDPGEGLLLLWRALSERGEDQRRRADEDFYFRTLRELGLPPEGVAALRAFLDVDGTAAEAAVAEVRLKLQRG